MAILLTAVGINYYFHQREQQEQLRQQRTRQLRKEIQQAVDALAVLKNNDAPEPVLQLLTNYSAQRIQQLSAINPGVMEQLQSQAPRSEPPPTVVTVHNVKALQTAIKSTLGILRQVQLQGGLGPAEMQAHSNDLHWLHISTEADFYIEEGRRHMEARKSAPAMANFKHARSLLSKISTKDPRRQPKLDEVRQLLDEANPFKDRPVADASTPDGGASSAPS